MKKIFLLSVLCVVCCSTVAAQDFRHTWKMAPLSWNDFTTKSQVNGKISYLEYYMGTEPTSSKVNGVIYQRPGAYAFMSPQFSWVDPNYRTPEVLAYNQCAFDLIEVYRRTLNSDLLNINFYEHEMLLDHTMRRLSDDLGRLESETNQGNDTAALHVWQRHMQHLLDSIPLETGFSHQDAPFRWGAYLGLGYMNTVGKLHNHFGGGVNLYWDLIFGVKRHFFDFGMNIGTSNSTGYTFNPERGYDPATGLQYRISTPGQLQPGQVFDTAYALWPKDDLIFLSLYAAYGYSVIDNATMRLTPFVGYSLQDYALDDDDSENMDFLTGALIFGLDYNWHITNTVDFLGVYDATSYNADHSMLDLNVRLYAAYDHFHDIVGAPRGLALNFQVGIGFLSGRARCK